MPDPTLAEVPDIGLATGGPSVCMLCIRTFTMGGLIVQESSASMFTICQWCIAAWLEAITGFKVHSQLASWETAKNSRKVTAWRGWKPPEDDSAPTPIKPID